MAIRKSKLGKERILLFFLVIIISIVASAIMLGQNNESKGGSEQQCGNACMTHCTSYHQELCADFKKYYLDNKDLKIFNISETCDNICSTLFTDNCITDCNGTDVKEVAQALNCSKYSEKC